MVVLYNCTYRECWINFAELIFLERDNYVYACLLQLED